MPLEAKRCRHGAVAIPIVAVGGLVAVSPRQQRAQPQQPDRRVSPTLVAWRGRQPVDRGLGFGTSPSAPRSSSVSTKTPVAGTPIPAAVPRGTDRRSAARISGMAPSRSPRLARSRAVYTSTTGKSTQVEPPLQAHVADLPSTASPRSRSAGESRCTSAMPSAHPGQAQREILTRSLGDLAAPPRCRAARRRRPAAPRPVSRNRRRMR